MKFVFWWDSPCKGMIGVLREICRLEPDTVVLTGKTGKRREAMGWMNQPCLFPQHVIMDYQSAEEWNSVQCRELQKYSGCFHVVNGLVRKTFRPLLSEILRQNLPFATMTEAPCNMMDGIKRPLKEIYMSRWLPLVHRPFATRAEAFLCLSGEKEQDLRKITHLGFPREKIYPFGYFTEEKLLSFAAAIEAKSEHPIAKAVLARFLSEKKESTFSVSLLDSVSGSLSSTIMISKS